MWVFQWEGMRNEEIKRTDSRYMGGKKKKMKERLS